MYGVQRGENQIKLNTYRKDVFVIHCKKAVHVRVTIRRERVTSNTPSGWSNYARPCPENTISYPEFRTCGERAP